MARKMVIAVLLGVKIVMSSNAAETITFNGMGKLRMGTH